MTKMAAMPIHVYMVKTLQKSSSWNQWADLKETLHVAFRCRALKFMYKSWPCDDLDLL